MKFYVTALLLAGALGASSALAESSHGGQLPPGLQKKVERGQPLPPGWQKKLNYREGDYFDRELLRYGQVRDIGNNRQRIEIEDRIYTVIKETREIIDVLDR
ncbi:hypothetical protein [Marinobacter sediminum]|uniref:hypothetical protein n=1 Tax=Marinobacter sediminum TaxID=256323 RepID=UPI00193AA491|nr:hypothetical protein [Marinobacter sediminum]